MVGALLTVSALGAGQASACDEAATRALTEAGRRVAEGDDEGALEALAPDRSAAGCAERELARLSVAAWGEARRLALTGGAPTALGPVLELLDQLAAVDLGGDADLARVRQLADAVVRAAVAAAQDERDEMSLYLTHAQGLAEALRLARREVRWPLPLELAAGELWLEVDRYAEARDAFERAADGPRTALGRARVLERTAGRDEACRAYRGVEPLASSPAARRQVVEAIGRLGCGGR